MREMSERVLERVLVLVVLYSVASICTVSLISGPIPERIPLLLFVMWWSYLACGLCLVKMSLCKWREAGLLTQVLDESTVVNPSDGDGEFP